MDATANTMVEAQRTPSQRGFAAYIIPASMLVNVLFGLVCLSLAVNLLSLEARLDVSVLTDIFSFLGGILGAGGVISLADIQQNQLAQELGRPVQDFAGLVALTPALVAFYATVLLWRRKPNGRYLTITLHYGVAVLAGFAVLHFWGVFLSIESIVDGIMQNSFMILGIPLAYGLFWLAGRFDEESTWRNILERGAFGAGILVGIALILYSDVLGSTNVIRVTADFGSWIATLMLIVFGFLAYRLLHFGEEFDETPQQRTAWQGWFLLSPNIVGFLIFFAGPLLLSFYLSFTDSSVGQTPELNGFANYAELLSLEFQVKDDPDVTSQSILSFGYATLAEFNFFGQEIVIGAKDTLFWRSIFNTIIFCMMLVPLSTIPALGLSMILNSKLPGVKFFRAIYFLPSVAAVVGTALIWRWLYDPTIGYFNYLISQVVNFLNSFGLNIADPEIAWLTGPGVMLFSIVFLAAWQVVGFNTVLFLAGLQGIPKVLYEAAMIDGANRWQQFRNVTLPMLAPTTFFVITTTIITGLQVFNEPYALFPARPIPAAATTGVYYIYNQGFNRFEFGYASSVAWLLFLLIFLVTFVQFRLQRSGAYED